MLASAFYDSFVRYFCFPLFWLTGVSWTHGHGCITDALTTYISDVHICIPPYLLLRTTPLLYYVRIIIFLHYDTVIN